MDILLHITSSQAAPIASGLANAFSAMGTSWACFLTGDGVKLLDDPVFSGLRSDAVRIAVCEHSWDQHMRARDCPVERGSQTVNSALMAEAGRVISL